MTSLHKMYSGCKSPSIFHEESIKSNKRCYRVNPKLNADNIESREIAKSRIISLWSRWLSVVIIKILRRNQRNLR